MTAPAQVPTQAGHARRGAARAGSVGNRLIALVGELLILAGALIGLYVLWQLFYTDVLGDQRQDELLESLDWAYQAPITAGDAAPGDPPAVDFAVRRGPETAPAMDEPGFGITFGTLYVPRWGSDYVKPISQGTTRREILDVLGIGHYEGTAMPGALGNFSISAHRTTYGKPFNRIAELEVGDPLVVQTEDAWYVYRVTEHLIVKPTAVEVIAPEPGQPGVAPSGRFITLTTCHPMYSAAERYIVHGELEYWAPAGDAVPEEIAQEAAA